MQLRDEGQRFLAKRMRVVQAWRYVGPILLAILVGLGLWLFLSKPLLANPFVVMTQLENDAIPESTMVLMAAMLPVVVLMCMALAVAVVLVSFAAFSNEKKYLQIIQREALERNRAQQGHGGGGS